MNQAILEILDDMILTILSKAEEHKDYGRLDLANNNIDVINILKELKKRISSLPSDTQWIDVKERLPEENEEFLGYDGFSMQVLKVWIDSDGNKYCVETQENLEVKPTHWMNLPLPPNN